MLRPATPLAVLLLVAFALQLLATLSAPIIQAIPLAENAGTRFGVFGSCNAQNTCTPIGLGYDASPNSSERDFNFQGAGTRRTLTYLLILHPVAALFTLIGLAMAIAAHFHAPSHSSRFLLGLVIFMAPMFLVSTVAFVMDLVLFLPHVAWATYIMIVASVLIFICAVLTCAMRRTLISRKTRKERVAQNAEMSGENFYNRQRAASAASPPPLSEQPTALIVNGAPDADKLPGFAVYDSKSRTSGDDDRTPLNSTRTATGLSGNSGQPRTSEDGTERYARGGSMRGGRGRGGYGPPRDQYGNPMPPPPGYAPRPGDEYMGRPSQDSQRSRGRGGYPPRGAPRGAPPYRGRGGGPPRGRGGPMRGGPISGRGGPTGMAYGGPSPPVPDYGEGQGYARAYGEPDYGPQRGQEYGDSYGPPVAYNAVAGAVAGAAAAGAYGNRRPSPGPSPQRGYGRQPSPGPPSQPGYGRGPSPGHPSNIGMRNPSPSPPSAPGYGAYGAAYTQQDDLARAESPPPLPGDEAPIHDTQPDPSTIGQAVEMDHLTGSPAISPGIPQQAFSDSDSEVQGMVGIQQNRQGAPLSPTSVYSSQRTNSVATSRFIRQNTPPLQTLHPTPPPPIAQHPSPQIQYAPIHKPSVARVSGDDYYEDVDPRFDPSAAHPASLTPGPQGQIGAVEHLSPYAPPRPGGPEQSNSFTSDGMPVRAPSDSSHFTSISERGVNPNWRPEDEVGYARGGIPNRGAGQQAQAQQQRDFVLSSNPDFEIGRGRDRAGSRAGAGGMPAGGMPAGGQMI